MKNSDIFHISVQKLDCWYSLEPPRRGGSNEYPQSMFLSRNKKNNVYPCKPQFYYIKVGFKGAKLYRYVFVMGYVLPRLIFHHFDLLTSSSGPQVTRSGSVASYNSLLFTGDN